MLTLGPGLRGPDQPLGGAPRRRPGSVRRTSTIDTRWPTGTVDHDQPLAVHAAARDLRTDHDGGPATLASVELRALVAPDRSLSAIAGPDPRLGELVGTSTMRGFRSAVADALPDLEASGAPLRAVVDDLPGALLVSGFAVLRAGGLAGSMDDRVLAAQIDVCAGWAEGTGMVEATRAARRSPTPVPVPSPSLVDQDDPDGWHDAPLPDPVATRRRRLLDVAPDPGDEGRLLVTALFRDSHIGPDRVERSFHEYAVEATVDRATGTITTIAARPGVLPWSECPGALASAGRVAGTSIGEVRTIVRSTFRGTTTCTHLNDVLAALGDVGALCAAIDRE